MSYRLIILILTCISTALPTGTARGDELLMGQVVYVDRENSVIKINPIQSSRQTATETGKEADAVSVRLIDGYLPSTIKKGASIRVWLSPASTNKAINTTGSLSGRVTWGRCGRCDCTGIRSRLKRSIAGGRGGGRYGGRAGRGR